MTHDYKRNGAIDLFAATNIATGGVLTDLRIGHTGADVLRFFKQIDAAVPRGLGVHVVLGTTCPPTAALTSRNGWPTKTVAVGTCTTPRPRVPG
jgi:hypothetical protein